MKRILLFSVAAATVAGLGYVAYSSADAPATPSVDIEEAVGGIDGAIKYMNARRANQVTGEIDPAWVINAQNQTRAMRMAAAQSKAASLGLQWQELGPDNIGGRTRAIVYDKNNPNIILAGGVAGGIWRTQDGGGSWAPVNDTMSALSVVSLAQAANGDFYAGTGEGQFYVASGLKSQGIVGGGVFKSTDGGQTFTLLQSTKPSPNSTASDWAAVGKIACSPTDANRIYAATNRGFEISNDGGATWTKGVSGFLNTREVIVTPSGAVWAQVGSTIYYSATGDPNSFTAISKPNAGANELPNNAARSAIAVSPQDENYVYVVNVTNTGNLGTVHRSTDNGATWSLIGQGSSSFNPMTNGQSAQGNFDLLLGVSNANKDEILMGGVFLWKWSLTNGWTQVHSSVYSPVNPFYVHVDQHGITYHPTNANHLIVGNDGGLFRSVNGGQTWTELNKAYNTIQYYTVTYSEEGAAMGGAQDNGTHFLSGTGNTALTGTRVFGGDGSYCEISKLNNQIFFASSQYGNVFRANDRVNFNTFLDANIDPNGNQGSPGFADFIASFVLWESTNDVNSIDSVEFPVLQIRSSLGFGNGTSVNYQGTLTKPQASAKFTPQSFRIEQGGLVVTSDANGVLSGDGTGTFNSQTGDYQVTMNAPSNLEFRVFCDISYSNGDVVYIKSNNGGYSFPYTVTQPLTSGDTIEVQDRVTSTFFMGRNAFSTAESALAGLWMTRDAIRFDRSPEFFQIANFGTNREVHFIAVTPDGDHAFVAASGVLFRISGLSGARDSATASIANGNTPVQTTTQIASFAGRLITSIAINPNNYDEVVVTLGNYGNTQYVHYSTNALSATPTFTVKQGNLPAMPVYSAVIDQSNANQVILGTDMGIFTTTNIKAGSVSWSAEAGGMPNVPVFALKQQTRSRASYPGDTVLNGVVYAATHGRGMWKTGTLASVNPVSTNETSQVTAKVDEPLKIFPNPAADRFQIEVDLIRQTDVTLVLTDLQGREVYRRVYQLAAGQQRLSAFVNLPAGVYSATVSGTGLYRTGKVVIR